MNHLDEGTIHAWLDGALDEAQARQVETHVAQCATCSALVAEARGIMAAASRIMSALDDVPGGVIPKGGVAAPATADRSDVTPIASRRAAPARWRITRWASGVAAVLVAAIVLSTSSKVQRSTDFSQVSGDPATEMRSDSALPATPLPVVTDSALIQPRGTERRAVASSAPSAPPVATPSPAREEMSRARDAVVASPRSTAGRGTEAANAPSPVAQKAVGVDITPTAGAVAGAARTTMARGEIIDTARIGMPRDSSRLRTRQDMAKLESMAVTSVAADHVVSASEAGTFAGCYRVGAAQESAGIARGAVGGVDVQRRTARAAPSAAAARQPRAAEPSEMSALSGPSVLRLDTVRTALGYAVRPPQSDSAIGSWRVIGDSVRVDFAPRGFIMLSRQQRIVCPTP